MKKSLIIIIVVVAVVVVSVSIYYFTMGNTKQNTTIQSPTVDNSNQINNKQTNNMNSQNNLSQNDQSQMTDLAKSIYQAFKKKDVNALQILAKTKITNDAVKANKSFDSYEKNELRVLSMDFNDDTEDLLPVDFSTITFVLQSDGTYKVQVIYSNRKSTNNLIVYLNKNPSLDMTSEQEIYLGKVDSEWVWVR
ncbi:MAG: hypothetical protein NTZ87_02700 [Candidatus Nomurabacteria bacterium]|nr:hypothetical protein [Candidatus Nomurabacteria bacterium]